MIYPILGAGSAPFRGHFSPHTVDMVLDNYPDVQTFTVQSAFKYDNSVSSVISAINKLKASQISKGYDVDEGKCIEIINKVSAEYGRIIEHLAPLTTFVPKRRMRKLHIGLFGYARSLGQVRLPRVISFCAACYSIGLPPEILGLNALNAEELAYLKSVHVNFMFDMKTAMSCFNEDVLSILPEEVKKSLSLDSGGPEAAAKLE